jgi:predicted PurR-regulated permease PerM
MDSTQQLKHVKLSLIAWANSTNLDELGAIETQMLFFASAITTYWEPVVTWSPITLLISQNGASLSLVTTGLLLITLLFYFINTRKLRQANALAYQKLPDHNKQIIDTIQNIEKTGPPTFNLIAEQHARTTGNSTSTDDLLKKLSETEGTGIIKSSIANDRDKPLQTWRTLL